ncbi:uncharacterized protein A1O5_04135 [Cladophialophora psammophila CBS 110553]|uniref:Uncharacterized protein n=1 Tax=Cladophialophora psammophila CBS 110553 TaxID=1182543 RepID=W9X7U4_9EURO|nr:uncharacterized protein A1O5_04135 [Cladophialophora psammophila CBS 110553]EXJ72986.1 hypothetical protein A1O5_04135 [Cladophialophora psammophila CBS 110553]
MATLLFSMRCFKEAFDILYLITHKLNNFMGEQIDVCTHVLFFAISCARSAETPLQNVASKEIAEQLEDWMEKIQSYLGSDQVCHMRSLLQIGMDGLKDETLEQAAYWAAVTTVSPSWVAIFPMWIEGTQLSLRAFLDFFYLSPDIQTTMLLALDWMERCLRWRRPELERLLRHYWLPDVANTTSLAQTLVYWLLEGHVLGASPFWSKVTALPPFRGTAGFYGGFMGKLWCR